MYSEYSMIKVHVNDLWSLTAVTINNSFYDNFNIDFFLIKI